MLKWLEKFVIKRIIKRVTGSILKNEEKTTVFVEEKIDGIFETVEKFVETKVLTLVQEAHNGLRDTQK